uniref:Uncharacterized protein n=1 Tax=Arundo donax TaxID=35708 RepID=A0A0A9C295_ARUDO
MASIHHVLGKLCSWSPTPHGQG